MDECNEAKSAKRSFAPIYSYFEFGCDQPFFGYKLESDQEALIE